MTSDEEREERWRADIEAFRPMMTKEEFRNWLICLAELGCPDDVKPPVR